MQVDFGSSGCDALAKREERDCMLAAQPFLHNLIPQRTNQQHHINARIFAQIWLCVTDTAVLWLRKVVGDTLRFCGQITITANGTSTMAWRDRLVLFASNARGTRKVTGICRSRVSSSRLLVDRQRCTSSCHPPCFFRHGTHRKWQILRRHTLMMNVQIYIISASSHRAQVN